MAHRALRQGRLQVVASGEYEMKYLKVVEYFLVSALIVFLIIELYGVTGLLGLHK